MKLEIKDKKTISEVQKEFGKMFPFLKIEFFSVPHKYGASSPRKEMVRISKTLCECRTVHTEGALCIRPQMTVAALEKAFRKNFGLSVQVFRKSGNAWLLTTVTDDWTLEQQNSLGAELSGGKNGKINN